MDNNQTITEDSPVEPRRGPSRKYPWAILIVIALFVIIPFISWYGTWFGRPLSDAKMEEYLSDRNKPRNVQHALAQIGNRIIDGDQAVKRFYPEVISASQHEQPEVRMTAAWAMGQDNKYEDFHPSLLKLLNDPIPGVRHNAALALVRFGDDSARPELVGMLEPSTIHAPESGLVELIVKEDGTPVVAGTPLVRITRSDGSRVEVRSIEAGRIDSLAVTDGKSVTEGDDLLTLAPSADQVWEALRALFVVGRPDDISYVQRYTRPTPSMPDRVQKQATSTIEEIRTRASHPQ